MVTVNCDMCGKDISNHDDGRTTISFPKEDCFVCYDVCRECANKIEEFIKASHATPEEQETMDKCNKEYCKDCESFNYTSSVIEPNKLHVKCEKRKQVSIVDLEHTVKPEDFNEED